MNRFKGDERGVMSRSTQTKQEVTTMIAWFVILSLCIATIIGDIVGATIPTVICASLALIPLLIMAWEVFYFWWDYQRHINYWRKKARGYYFEVDEW